VTLRADSHCPAVLPLSPFRAEQPPRRDRVVCACTHYLVFKEPAERNARSAPRPLVSLAPAPERPRLGEPSKVTNAIPLRQGFFRRCRNFFCRPVVLTWTALTVHSAADTESVPLRAVAHERRELPDNPGSVPETFLDRFSRPEP